MVKQVGDDGSGQLLLEHYHQLIWGFVQSSTELSEQIFPCVEVRTKIADGLTLRE